MLRTRKIVNGARCLVLLAAAGSAYPASLSNVDKEFLITAARTDLIEAHEGQMAEKQASHADVKDLGKTLVQDHTQSYQQLTALAAKTGVSIPKGIDAAKDRTIAQLAPLKGARFDHQFTKRLDDDCRQSSAPLRSSSRAWRGCRREGLRRQDCTRSGETSAVGPRRLRRRRRRHRNR